MTAGIQALVALRQAPRLSAQKASHELEVALTGDSLIEQPDGASADAVLLLWHLRVLGFRVAALGCRKLQVQDLWREDPGCEA